MRYSRTRTAHGKGRTHGENRTAITGMDVCMELSTAEGASVDRQPPPSFHLPSRIHTPSIPFPPFLRTLSPPSLPSPPHASYRSRSFTKPSQLSTNPPPSTLPPPQKANRAMDRNMSDSHYSSTLATYRSIYPPPQSQSQSQSPLFPPVRSHKAQTPGRQPHQPSKSKTPSCKSAVPRCPPKVRGPTPPTPH